MRSTRLPLALSSKIFLQPASLLKSFGLQLKILILSRDTRIVDQQARSFRSAVQCRFLRRSSFSELTFAATNRAEHLRTSFGNAERQRTRATHSRFELLSLESGRPSLPHVLGADPGEI